VREVNPAQLPAYLDRVVLRQRRERTSAASRWSFGGHCGSGGLRTGASAVGIPAAFPAELAEPIYGDAFCTRVQPVTSAGRR
jgi:hypothetical protein